MPKLNWIGKDKVENHHNDVPFKVLEHAYGFTAENGKRTEPTGSGNLLIKGDNLEALKALLPQYEGRVKCIYIDPPYNTGNENWVYNDNVNSALIKKWLGQVVGKEGEDLSRHDKWLCMMYPRLKLLHKLLANDGAIFISIDDNEQAALKLICDEIFGSGNFISNIIWLKTYSTKNDAKYFSEAHDFISVFAKNKAQLAVNLLSRSDKSNSNYKYDDKDGRGPFRTGDILVKSFSQTGVFPIKNPITGVEYWPAKGSCYRFTSETAQKLLEENRFYFGKKGDGAPQLKRYLNEVKDGIVAKTVWDYQEVGHNQDAADQLKQVFQANKSFDTPKPLDLITRIVQLASSPDSIILDSFAGSGTTAHAVLQLNNHDGGNRKFILVEMEDYAETITAERIRRVMQGVPQSKNFTLGLGGAFDFYTLGLPLFHPDGLLNEAVGETRIREYIWFTESRLPLPPATGPAPAGATTAEKHYLGLAYHTAVYFYYLPGQATALDMVFLAGIRTAADAYLIYADELLMSTEQLRSLNITFKKIPRDITRI